MFKKPAKASALLILLCLIGCGNEIVHMEGKYINEDRIGKQWGSPCYLVQESGIRHMVSCIYQDEPVNQTIRIKGEKIPPKKIPDDYVGQVVIGDTHFPGYIKILEYE